MEETAVTRDLLISMQWYFAAAAIFLSLISLSNIAQTSDGFGVNNKQSIVAIIPLLCIYCIVNGTQSLFETK